MTASNTPEDSVTKDLREAMIKSLRDYRCQYIQNENGDGLSLLDVLSPGPTIAEGEQEIVYMVEHIIALLASRPMVCPHCKAELIIIRVDKLVALSGYGYVCNCPDSAFRERENKG